MWIDGTVEDVGVGLSSPAVYLTVAEYFREDLQQDVLLFIDNIFRFGTSPGHISGEVQSTCQTRILRLRAVSDVRLQLQ